MNPRRRTHYTEGIERPNIQASSYSSRISEQEQQIREAFNDFVDIDVMDVTCGGLVYNELAEAADRLLEQVLEILYS